MTHTPGPWTADLEDTNGHVGWSIYGSNDRRVATVYVNTVSSSDKIGETALNPQNAESVANARLIAAAPQLLEACKAIVTFYDKGIDGSEDDMDMAYDAAKAAIAAAEGEP